ncbi:cytochrome P450 [Aspergillus saccharolyticus JOP 1030-1]|uniref:Benzoate 4-monooxygenase cytochrome P450 n=1 Tax=Aspergillus saccharolyticus JOP 1030-1 TaxID=1450539 RepID=A0A318ZU83_9EURO|nr:benzoate 4-monooxygenase cytochrome P450 [Aspergillus saccharolyticus JOP 1030-1]PYH47883.1 benzoate 4-monooxygenase cytochrome P450 [Aspergillus saccharolyticus JOP 1030-1]
MYKLTQWIYRLYFHPLSSIPGPKLAAMTSLFEFYHDVIRRGKYIWEIEKMHAQYGPIVRITPRQVHVADPEFYEKIYAGANTRREKDPEMTAFMACPTAALATIDHDLHRSRRNQLNHFFSKRNVGVLMPIIYEKVDMLCEHLRVSAEEGTVIKLSDAFVALTGDTITHYCYGQDWGCLRAKHFTNNGVWDAVAEITNTCHLFQVFPLVPRLLMALPRRLVGWVKPKLITVFDMQDRIARDSKACLKGSVVGGPPTIYHSLSNANVPAEERSLVRLREESFVLLLAGTETTAGTLTYGMYQVLRNKEIFFKLRKEVQSMALTSDGRVPWPQVESLPYLTGVVNESLRLGSLVMRFSRVAPQEALYCNGYTIPPGTPMSTSSYFIHHNPVLFPNPKVFDPERWITARQEGVNLSKYLVAFTRGTRACVGMNLSYAELYTALATIVLRFDLELYDTPPESMAFRREMIVQRPEKGLWTLKARVTGVKQETE